VAILCHQENVENFVYKRMKRLLLGKNYKIIWFDPWYEQRIAGGEVGSFWAAVSACQIVDDFGRLEEFSKQIRVERWV